MKRFLRTLRVLTISFGALGLALLAFWGLQGNQAEAQAVVAQKQLPGNKIQKFVDPLPGLHAIVDTGSQIVLSMEEFKSPVMPSTFIPATGTYTGTWVWGYRQAGQTATSYIGPVIVARRDIPTEMKYVNNLGDTNTSNVLAWIKSTDQTLHWADPKGEHHMMPMTNYAGPIPAVAHLHGGEVPPQLDGGPDAWFLSNPAGHSQAWTGYSQTGHAYHTRYGSDPAHTAVYSYPNTQEAANIWFHDHALGITRLNVYAGLAGAYLLSDPGLALPSGLAPHGLGIADPLFGDEPIVPLAIQDRMFDTNGQLFFPNIGINPEHPFWIPEFVGDTIVVNGKVWPFKQVDRKRYRFLFLNGSNARAYDMFLIDQTTGVKGPRMWVIGTDGGYLDMPVMIDPNTTLKTVQKSLVMMPGERYDVIIDFNDQAWLNRINAAYAALGVAVPNPLNLILRNTAKTPFPGGAPASVNTTGRVIQFRVSATAPADFGYNPDPATGGGQSLRPAMVRLVNPATGALGTGVTVHKTRQLTLNEVMGPGGPLEVLVNNTRWDGKSVDIDNFPGGLRPDFTGITTNLVTTYYSEIPAEGRTEVWEIVNLTADAHPIHLHLVQFQLMNRQVFDVAGYNAAYDALFPPTTTVLDPMTGLPYPGGMFIGGYGPPKAYDFYATAPNIPARGPIYGGNPDVTPFINLKKNPLILPLPQERGWKDTVIMYPGQITRIVVRWAPTHLAANTLPASAYFPFDPNGGHGYVWHCHIIDHEDNEMMRPTSVMIVDTPSPAARTLILGSDY